MIRKRGPLQELLRRTTVAISGALNGTGFFVAPDLILTCAHNVGTPSARVDVVDEGGAPVAARVEPGSFRPVDGDDLVLLRIDVARPGPYAPLAAPAEPGDELWTYGYPDGMYRSGDSMTFESVGPSRRDDGSRLLRAAHGRATAGFSGAPVLNWRTGAVCGVLCRSSPELGLVRLVPAATVMAAYPQLRVSWHEQREWLDQLDDDAVRAAGLSIPGPTLREVLLSGRRIAHQHPYADLMISPPKLSNVYVRQQATPEPSDTDSDDARPTRPPAPVDAVELLGQRPDVTIVGDAGSGKSSLLRHIMGMASDRLLAGDTPAIVPILVRAQALARNVRETPLDMLANGLAEDLSAATVERRQLVELLKQPPMPGASWLVMVDGLDEITDAQLRALTAGRIAAFRRKSGYSVAVTSRPLGRSAPGGPDGYAPAYGIEPFRPDQLSGFARGWFTALGVADVDHAVERFMSELTSSHLDDLARIPLIATMLCIVFGNDPTQPLPLDRADLYGAFVKCLVAKGEGETTIAGDAGSLLSKLAYEAPPDRVGAAMTQLESRNSAPAAGSRWRDTVRDFLCRSGLVVAEGDGVRFLHPTIEAYLSACHMVLRYPDPGRRDARDVLRSQSSWPWEDADAKAFAVALWLKEGRRDGVERRLTRLLRRSAHRSNLGFLAELVTYGVPLPDRVRTGAADVCERAYRRETRTADQETLLGWLATLDENRAATLLEQRAMKETHAGWTARYAAAEALTRMNPARGAIVLRRLVIERSFDAGGRLRAARLARDVDPRLGAELLRVVAEDVDAGEVAVTAAVELTELDARRGVAALGILATASKKHQHRVQAALALASRADIGSNGMRLLVEMALMPSLDAEARVMAARAVGQWDRAAAEDLLDRLVREPLPINQRVSAASLLLGFDPARCVATVRAVATADGIGDDDRLTLATTLRGRPSADAFGLFDELARRPMASASRLSAAMAAANIDPYHGSHTLAGLAVANGIDADDRQRAAVAAIGMNGELIASLLPRLATDKSLRLDAGFRLGMAMRLLEEDSGAADIVADIASDKTISAEGRMVAAEAVGRHAPTRAIGILETVVGERLLGTRIRFQAARATIRYDPTGSQRDRLLFGIASDPNELDRTRFDFATELGSFSRERALEAFIRLCDDRHADSQIRLDAASAAMSIDPAEAHAAVTQLARAPRVPEAVHEQARRLAGLEEP